MSIKFMKTIGAKHQTVYLCIKIYKNEYFFKIFKNLLDMAIVILYICYNFSVSHGEQDEI